MLLRVVCDLFIYLKVISVAKMNENLIMCHSMIKMSPEFCYNHVKHDECEQNLYSYCERNHLVYPV